MELGRVGVWLSSRLLGGAEAPEAVAEVDDLGYGALWIGSAPGDLELVERLLAGTPRIVVATGIVNVWTEPADVTAAAYARVSAAYPDRLLLGLGAGHKALVEAQTDQKYVRPYHKVVAYLDALDAADPPVPRQGRVLAALGPRMVELARDRSAGAHPYLVTPEHTHTARTLLGPGPLLAPEQKVVLEKDPARARTIARDFLSRYLAMPNYTNNWLRLGFTGDDLAGGGSDRLVDALVAWGDPATVLTRVAEHRQAGADHVCVQPLNGTSDFPLAELRELAGALRG